MPLNLQTFPDSGSLYTNQTLSLYRKSNKFEDASRQTCYNSKFAEMAKASQQEQQTPGEICWLANLLAYEEFRSSDRSDANPRYTELTLEILKTFGCLSVAIVHSLHPRTQRYTEDSGNLQIWPQSLQSAGPVRFLIFCSISIFLLASLVAGRRPQCNSGAE
jgi:hypothetical protein